MPDFDPREQRRIMGMFATGVSMVTTGTGDTGWAMTANSILSLSLTPRSYCSRSTCATPCATG